MRKINTFRNATNSMLVWTPDTDKVAVIAWPDHSGESDDYLMSALGCWKDMREMDALNRTIVVLSEALSLIIRDNVPAHAVHNAMLSLEEYQAAIALDMPKKKPK